LRADSLLAEIPIILITALDDRNSRLQGLEVGADDFISKPFDRVELRARVQTITRLNRYRRLLEERAQRQQVEAEIRQQEHELNLMKETDRLKTQFISDVAHELRTPLSIITLMIGNLDRLYMNLDDETRHKLIQDVRKHIRSLNDLIDSVLETSRIDSGRVSEEREALNLALLVRQEVEKHLPLAQEKSQIIDINSAETVRVWGNENQLRQVIRNLLNNAIKYTPEGAQITCECLKLAGTEISSPEWPGSGDFLAADWAALRVVDTGVGIDAKDLPHLFERFYRVKTQDKIPGTGLGLAIVQEFVTAHNGHVAVASNPGQGSIFALYLPLLEDNTP
jgi:signal transduction histidine kinase